MKFTKLFFILLSVTFMAFQGCKTTQNKLSSGSLEGKWILKSMNGEAASSLFSTKVPTLNFDFDKNSVFGNGGCNSYGGNFTLSGNKLSVTNVISTMMACVGAEKEGVFFQTLSKEYELSVNGNQMMLKQGAYIVFTFEKAKPVTVHDLSGRWMLEVLEGATANVYFTDVVPTINFDAENMRVTGNSGCNNYNAPFELNGGQLKVEKMALTRRGCPNGMEGERKYVQLVSGMSDIEIEGDRLILKRDGIHVATFVKEIE